MAFDDEENGIYDLIVKFISNLYETYDYDKWLVDKYQLCRRIIDGTITAVNIDDSQDAREILASMKAISNRIAFKSPKYNPAGVRRATKFDDQYLMLDADREAITTTSVLATSYFLNEAQTRTNMTLIDSFSDTDEERLAELLEEAYVPFTAGEKTALSTILGVIISRDFFMDYHRALDANPETNGKRQVEFENPTTLERNVFLHAQDVISTSPFANACVFTSATPSVESVSVSPATANVVKGSTLQLSASVSTTGFANKSVVWSVDETSEADGVEIDLVKGLLTIPSTATVETITVSATSVFDKTVVGTATISVVA